MASGSFSNNLHGFKERSFFPPPQFLSLNHCGLDISQEVARFIRFDDTYEGVRIKTYGETPLVTPEANPDENTSSDTNRVSISAMLHKMGTRFVRVVVPEDKVYLFRLKTPRVHDKELRTVIDFKLEENIPIPRSDVSFEYDIISKTETEYLISVSAVSNEYINSTSKFIESAGLIPVLFDTEGRCTARTLSSNENLNLVVTLKKQYTSFVITYHGAAIFSSTTPIGSRDLTRSIMKGLSVTQKEAIKLKKDKLIKSESDDADFFSSILGLLSSLKDEINRVLIYWDSHGQKEGLPEVSNVVLVGTDMMIPDVTKYLNSSLKTPAVIADVWVNVFSPDKHVPEISKEDSLNYASLIGISLT